MKKLILLDLDNTLFDSATYRKNLFQKIASCLPSQNQDIVGICEEIYSRMNKDIGLMDPDLFIAQMEEVLGSPEYKERILECMFDQNLLKNHLHTEVLEELPKLHTLGEIGILSQGEMRLQLAKLTGFKHLLHPEMIYIARDKKAQMAKIFNTYSDYTIFFIDDMLPMLREAFLINPAIMTIWIKRGRYAQGQQPFPDFKPFAEVETLTEVVDIIKRID